MFFRKRTRFLATTGILLSLGGCSVFEQFLEALDMASQQPRFAFVTMQPVVNSPADNTIHAYSGGVHDSDTAILFNEYVPFPDRRSDFTHLVMAPDGQHVALGFDEPFGFMFDSWVKVLDDELNVEFSASDDMIGTDIREDCDTTGPEFLADFGDQLATSIADGTFPPGSTGLVDWGEGTIIAGGFVGWLTANSFAAFIENDPPRFVVLPGDPTPLALGPGLSENTINITYEKIGAGWRVVGCSLEAPVIPPHPTPLRDLSLADSTGALPQGVILLDGAELLDLNGVRVTGSFVAEAVDGPYPE